MRFLKPAIALPVPSEPPKGFEGSLEAWRVVSEATSGGKSPAFMVLPA